MMVVSTQNSLQWSAQFVVSPSPRNQILPGDKITLPPSALEQLLSASSNLARENARKDLPQYDPFNPSSYSAHMQAESQYEDQRHQLPYPLTFKLVNPENGKVVYAGIREFSAEEGEAVLSPFLWESLGLQAKESFEGGLEGSNGEGKGVATHSSGLTVTVHAKLLERGTYVKLRPLEAGYNPDDWKALLEQYLRQNYTTLTNGELLVVQGGGGVGKKEEFRFLIDGFKPEADSICVVDTDLEVDIEALNEEQARETLERIAERMATAPGTEQGSSRGGDLDLFKAQEGQVLPGEYVDYEVSSWNRAQLLEIELNGSDDDEEVDLLVNPLSVTQRAKPRLDEHVFADFDGRPAKRIRLSPSNVELENAEAIYVSVHGFAPPEAETNGHEELEAQAPTPRRFTLRALHPTSGPDTNGAPAPESEVAPTDLTSCKNCGQWVPQRTLMLHENFCLRNNALCPHGCGQIFKKGSPEHSAHWHCPHDTSYGNTLLSRQKHTHIHHPQTILHCPECATLETFPSFPALAHHRTTTCPAKPILCRFCHLVVPQEGDPDGPNPEALLSGMTPHELADGARTTECHLCAKIVRLRDMHTHLANHDLDRLSRPPPTPCRNVNCGRTLDVCAKNGDTRAGARMGQGCGNDIGLCSVDFGPLYVSMHDPEGKALKRRIERRYLQQLLSGCGKEWCGNEFCKAGRKNRGLEALGSKEATPLIGKIVSGLADGSASPLHLCTDQKSQQRRGLAEMLAAEDGGPAGKGGYRFEWCMGALEAEGGVEGARAWLANWAPQRKEEDR